ncbi:hypothetical protein HQ393_03325 [Chitinibacter bivalviorum]|uniref:Uncharacterized protein n=1 Tax=Chitinibacter bivalviorum TaxID=2739434 RepID=A0A7H9BIJ0_9NEIS|nr:hypothetical protein [Chitinibacter bivalviorum]QLG87364.1 hypothetical protein HQ393_03325 [Chitinibacter bivalviorum]
MPMKKYELEKRKAEKLHNDLQGTSTPDRFGTASAQDKKRKAGMNNLMSKLLGKTQAK